MPLHHIESLTGRTLLDGTLTGLPIPNPLPVPILIPDAPTDDVRPHAKVGVPSASAKLTIEMGGYPLLVRVRGAHTLVDEVSDGGRSRLAAFRGIRSIAITGTAEADQITLGDGLKPTTVDALAGDDTVYGGSGNETILGGAGDDQLFGNAGNDFLDGGLGKDRLDGGVGANVLVGGSGTDYIRTRSPADRVKQDGRDRLVELA